MRYGWSCLAGALFAAFPDAYATVFSGFYSAFMLLLIRADLPGGLDRVPEQDEVGRMAAGLGHGIFCLEFPRELVIWRRGRERDGRNSSG